jgi:hypothetical protein
MRWTPNILVYLSQKRVDAAVLLDVELSLKRVDLLSLFLGSTLNSGFSKNEPLSGFSHPSAHLSLVSARTGLSPLPCKAFYS